MEPKRAVLPEYDAATTAVTFKILQSLVWAGSPILNQIQKVSTTELPQSSAPAEVAIGSVSSVGMEATLTERVETIVATDVDSWLAMLDEQADKAREQMEKQFFDFLHKVTEETGQVVDAGQRPISHDLILDMLEKVHIDFDENGNPELPTMVVHPELANRLMKLGEPTSDHVKRHAEIIERKRREFLARRRVRKLD